MRYIFGLMIETDEPVTINNAGPMIEEIVKSGKAEIVSIEAVENDEQCELPM